MSSDFRTSLRSNLLAPLATAFRLGAGLHCLAYRRGWLRTHQLGRPVVSVGNLTVGGSGKTPLVALVAEMFLKRGWKPAILTRGYGRRRGPDLVEIAPALAGEHRKPDPREVGDEPALLARRLPTVPIVVSADRYRAGRLAEERYGVDVHILDDGFQHLALARDVDIVALDGTRPLPGEALLPAGPMREPLTALSRAHIVVLTRAELATSTDLDSIEMQVRRLNPEVEIFTSRTKLCGVADVFEGNRDDSKFQCSDCSGSERVVGKKVYAFCGIGNPEAFGRDLERWGFSVVGTRFFPDHHVYTGKDLAGLLDARVKSGALGLVTTEKDVMNLENVRKGRVSGFDHAVVACIIRADLADQEEFESSLLQRLQRAS